MNYEKKGIERELEHMKKQLETSDRELAKCRRILDEREGLVSKMDVEKRSIIYSSYRSFQILKSLAFRAHK